MPVFTAFVHRFRIGSERRCFWIAIGVIALLPSSAWAQARPITLQNVTVLTGHGQTLTDSAVTFHNGKITGVGTRSGSSFLDMTLDARGQFVTPGFIDACGTLALRAGANAAGPSAIAVDAFDRFAEPELTSALRHGITTVYLPARTSGGIGGLGSIVRLHPGAPYETIVVQRAAALSAAVGAGRQGPLERVRTAEDLRARFRAALDYREALETYAEELKEYEQKLEERAKKTAEGTPQTQPAPRTARPATGGRTATAPPRPPVGGPQRPSAARGPQADEIKKPQPPTPNRDAEVLLRVLDGELHLRVEAHDPADIQNVLDAAHEYNVALMLEGATAAHYFAPLLAERRIPVILTGEPPTLAAAGDVQQRFARTDLARVLQDAGVDVYWGSGSVTPASAPELLFTVARAMQHGYTPADPIATLTSRPAALLGLEQDTGQIAPGFRADLVVWSGHPLLPGSRVERVYVGGLEVYRVGRDPALSGKE